MSHSIKNNDSDDEHVRLDKLKLLFEQPFAAVLYAFIAAVIYVGILWSELNSDLVFIWLGVIIFFSCVRILLFILYRNINPTDQELLAWQSPYFITVMLSSLVWGFGTVLLVYNLPFLYQVITYFILMGLAGSALALYSVIRYISISMVLALLTPITLLFLFVGSDVAMMVAALGILFILATIKSTRMYANTLHYSYAMTYALGRAKEEAEKLASTDMLTELNNRRAFTELSKVQIDYCKRHEHPVSVITLDIDHFKNVNDTRGHAAGDIALQHLSTVLKNITRSSDIIGRVGGEEFAIFLSTTTLKEALIVAEKIRKWVADNPVHVEDDYFSMTVSVGVASGDNYDFELLLNHADKAMYKAKEAGRNKVICYEDG